MNALTYLFTFDIHGIKLAVNSDEPELAERLRTFLGLFPSPATSRDSWLMSLRRADGNSEEKPAAEVVPSNGAKVLVSNSSGSVTMHEKSRLIEVQIGSGPAGWATLLVPVLKILQNGGVFVMHSSAFSNRSGRGFLFPGNHASGKTTIAYTALRSGCSIVADDILLLRRQGQDVAFLPFLSVLTFEEGKPTKRMFDVLKHYPKEVFQPAINPRFVLFPEITQQPLTTVKPISDKREVFDRLLTYSMLVEDRSQQAQQLKTLWELAGKMSAFELLLGQDHRASPEVLNELLEEMETIEK